MSLSLASSSSVVALLGPLAIAERLFGDRGATGDVTFRLHTEISADDVR